MLFLVCLAIGVIVLAWGIQAWWSLRLAICYPPRKLKETDDGPWPQVVVLLPLRGSDPVLADCLRGLFQQEYLRFQVHIILDGENDPAAETVRVVMAEFPAVRTTVSVLDERLPTCSLKVSALLQAIAELDPGCDVVAQIDADVVPLPGWLKELVRPFTDPRVGAVSGLRWYHTNCEAWGSQVRCLWGWAAAAQMHGLGILWGGSLSVRASLLREPGLREQWARSFVEDTSIVGYLRKRGYRLRTLPRLTLVNTESTSLAGCFRFIRRQILCVRLHHPGWSASLFVTLGLAISPLLAVAAACACWLNGASDLAWTVLGVLGAMVLLAGLPLLYIDALFYFATPKEERLPPLRWKQVPVIPLTMLVHFVALLSACWLREIDWRGVRYAVDADGGVRRLDYAPYTDAPAQGQSIV